LIIDIAGTQLTQADTQIIADPFVSGIILFARNCIDKEQVKSLIQSINKIRSSFIIAVDQEGGRVQRFINGFTKIPAMAEIGWRYNENNTQGLLLAKEMGLTIGLELKDVGVNVNFAPVVDLQSINRSVINDRAFHTKPQIVHELAKQFIRGMHQAGIASVIKHFPGHGNVIADSHVALPIDDRLFKDIAKNDLIPFRALIKESNCNVMTSHILFSMVDKNIVTFSPYWLKNVLRKELNFNGVIFSDDLSMQAAVAVGDIKLRVKLAFRAGCNKVLICNDREAVCEVLSALNKGVL